MVVKRCGDWKHERGAPLARPRIVREAAKSSGGLLLVGNEGWLKSGSVAEGVFDLVSHPASSVADGAEDAAAVDRVELRIGQLDIFRVLVPPCFGLQRQS